MYYFNEAKFILGKLKLEPMQPAALLSQAHVLLWRPLILQGFLSSSHIASVLLLLQIITDPFYLIFCQFLRILLATPSNLPKAGLSV